MKLRPGTSRARSYKHMASKESVTRSEEDGPLLSDSSIPRPIIAIVGPTASGKSSLAQHVALELDGEVVSADSMQVYRLMDIGTAKVPQEQQLVTHHLIDIADPGSAYSAQLFQTQARAAFATIEARDRVPILCGGTGFYIQAALEDMRFPEGEQADNPFREELERYRALNGNEALWKLLETKDAPSAQLIHPNNHKRVIRALEMLQEGISYAEQSKGIKQLAEVVPSIRFYLDVDPAILAERINERVDAMREAGLVDEVEHLMELGFEQALTARQAIGYKEIIEAKRGKITLDEAFARIKTATRRYAKRQRSWFRRDERLIPLDTQRLSQEEMVSYITSRYRKALDRIENEQRS